MDPEDLQPKRATEAVIALGREDLSSLSIEELGERITSLQDEIARCEAQITSKQGSLSAAEAVFGKP